LQKTERTNSETTQSTIRPNHHYYNNVILYL